MRIYLQSIRQFFFNCTELLREGEGKKGGKKQRQQRKQRIELSRFPFESYAASNPGSAQ